MSVDLSKKLKVGISSRALFDLDESHQVYEQQGTDAYCHYQITHEDDPLKPGVAMPLVKKLLNLQHPETKEPLVEVILISRNSADTGLRVFNSIQHYQINITRAAFTQGINPYQYICAFGADLFLSANADDVRHALQANCAAATLLASSQESNQREQLRIAFDGDAVLFSDEAERVFQKEGLDAFKQREHAAAKELLPGGPFKGFLTALHNLQRLFPSGESCPIRTALVTARDAPAHERVIKTLRAWNIRIDEALFLGGLDKGKFLKAFDADIFFDDQKGHCESAKEYVTAGHVLHGIRNEE